MTATVIDLQRYRAERRARDGAVLPASVGMAMMMVPAVVYVPVVMMPAAFMPQPMTVPAS